MDEGRLIDIARRAMADLKAEPARERGYTFYHGLRVARIARRLLERIGEPLETTAEVIFAAALFHDVGKPGEPHNEIGSATVVELLAGELSDEDLRAAARIVRDHNQRRCQPCWVASRVVQDADLLDHFGAQDVWIALHWSSAHEETCEQALAFFHGEKNARHVAVSRESLSFEASREAFERRVAFQRRFLEQFAAELRGEP